MVCELKLNHEYLKAENSATKVALLYWLTNKFHVRWIVMHNHHFPAAESGRLAGYGWGSRAEVQGMHHSIYILGQ